MGNCPSGSELAPHPEVVVVPVVMYQETDGSYSAVPSYKVHAVYILVLATTEAVVYTLREVREENLEYSSQI